MSAKDTTETDTIIGHHIAKYRYASGLSRQDLAEQIGVTHQQLQKYEQGTNRIAASRLVLVAKALKQPFDSFIEEIDISAEDAQSNREALSLMKNYYLLEPDMRVIMLKLFNSLPKQRANCPN